ncbi:MAG: lipoate--protein ligase family protein [Paludibacteraceae bacterium]|nr:lipoate--protein ligase family protein [Paludibacteraceae bacterium]
MLRVIVPDNKRLVWYLAAEEYLAQTVKEDTLFMWIVDPTVIFGRHQVIENEVNLEFCRTHGVQFYRRKSGGGCVYADRGNLMTSFITPDTHSEEVFQRYLDTMSAALREIGFPAVKSEHNDILVGEHKVSGNACYALPTGTIVHGTMLYDVDFDALQQAITPSREKLQKHGVESVRQRVINLKTMEACRGINSTEELEERLMELSCQSSRNLTDDEMDAINNIEATYLEPKFIYGN